MRHAIVSDGVVVQVQPNADDRTVPCPDHVVPGYTFDGETWAAPEAAVSVPTSVTPLQARKALRAAGMLDVVNAWIAQQPEEVQEVWEYALTIERDNPTILAAAEALELTIEQLDALFVAAAQM